MKQTRPISIQLSPGRIATLACSWEVAAPKPGNVHRGADFEDATLEDFLTSAVVLGQVIDDHAKESVGQTILSAVVATKAAIGTNTNLGIVLLLIPLAKALSQYGALSSKTVAQVLDGLTPNDASDVFDAIQLAKPGGLGSVAKGDVVDPATSKNLSLIAAMELAADRDLVARQYANGFAEVFGFCQQRLRFGQQQLKSQSPAIVFAHVATMAEFPDSLIARKCGMETALHSRMLAQKAIECFQRDPASEYHEEFWNAVSELDFWLRSDEHRRNPGTTADLIVATLFVAIHQGNFWGNRA